MPANSRAARFACDAGRIGQKHNAKRRRIKSLKGSRPLPGAAWILGGLGPLARGEVVSQARVAIAERNWLRLFRRALGRAGENCFGYG